MMQSAPNLREYYGSDFSPSTFAITEFLSDYFENIYTSSTYEINSNRVVGGVMRKIGIFAFWGVSFQPENALQNHLFEISNCESNYQLMLKK